MPVPVENRPRIEGVHLPIPLIKGPPNVRDIRRAELLDLRFPTEWIDKLALTRPSLYENPQASIHFLKSRGFANPVKLITSLPAILGLASNNIDAKIEGLKQRGFANPVKLITSSSRILAYTFDNIDAKIEGLKQRGFDNPVKLITSSPTVLDLTFDNIDAKLEGLKQRGFDNPVKLITSSPTTLDLAFDNIDAKLEGLKQRGFANPIKLFTSAPVILGFTFDNIDRKIRLLCLLYRERTKAIREIETLPTLLGYNWRRLLFAVRASSPGGLRRLITFNPLLLAAAKGTTGSDNPTELATAARKLQRLDDIEHIINQLIDDGRIDPRLVRALSRLGSSACRETGPRAARQERTRAKQRHVLVHQHVGPPSRSLQPELAVRENRQDAPQTQRRLDVHL